MNLLHGSAATAVVGNIRRLRRRAETYRIVAELMTGAESRAAFLRFAADYDRLADAMEHPAEAESGAR